MKMLDVIKVMQEQEIFKLHPNGNLDCIVENINQETLKLHYHEVKNYLCDLARNLSYEHNVEIVDKLSGFNDTFSFEMFDIAFTSNDFSNGIRQKEINFGKAGIGSFGIDMLHSTFTLEERKLLKLINHYFISLMSKNGFDDDFFFIPLKNLKCIFTTMNNYKCKEEIINTCNRINEKIIYWNIEDTKYAKRFNKSLLIGDKEKLVDINILYLPKLHKSGCDGESVEIKGIICKITNFMKIRYKLSQISNRFPKINLNSKYLEYMISERIDYRLHMLHGKDKASKHKKKVNTIPIPYKKTLSKLADSIYVYANSKYVNKTYLGLILNEPNSKKNIVTFMDALITAICNLSAVYRIEAFIVLSNKYRRFPLFNSKDNRWLLGKEIYDLISCSSQIPRKGYVKRLFEDGEISVEISFKVY